MSYEVYIDVEHHDKHFQGGTPGKESWCVRYSHDPEDGNEELIAVCNALREMADKTDPRYVCSNCGKLRGEHFRLGGLYYCFGKYGPVAQHDWWSRPEEVWTASPTQPPQSSPKS